MLIKTWQEEEGTYFKQKGPSKVEKCFIPFYTREHSKKYLKPYTKQFWTEHVDSRFG